MKKDNYKVIKIKHMGISIIFILLLIVFFYFLFITQDDKVIKNIKDYIKDGNKVIYISDKKSYSKYPIKLFEKYDIEYFYINSDKLSSIEKSKIQKIINSNYLSSIIVIFENGKVKDAMIEYDSEESLNNFLQNNDIIPEIIGENEKILSTVNELLKSNYLLMYIPYKKSDVIDYQLDILKDISKEYNIEFEKIDAYLLSNTQKNKLNTMLQISSVEDQIVILIKDGKIIGSIRDVMNKRNYLDKLDDFKFIDELDSYITYINFNEYSSLINDNNKSIISIGKDDCKQCDEVIKTLDNIAINHDITVNYINIGKMDSSLSQDVEKALKSINYKDGFTTPLTIMVEKGVLLDFVVGVASEDYFIDVFKENGIIK